MIQFEFHGTVHISMGESNTVVSAYTLYRHLQQYCFHPSTYKKFAILMHDIDKGDHSIMHRFIPI